MSDDRLLHSSKYKVPTKIKVRFVFVAVLKMQPEKNSKMHHHWKIQTILQVSRLKTPKDLTPPRNTHLGKKPIEEVSVRTRNTVCTNKPFTRSLKTRRLKVLLIACHVVPFSATAHHASGLSSVVVCRNCYCTESERAIVRYSGTRH